MTAPSGPRRIQLRRTAGWRKPEGAVVVARPTVFGNPWTLGHAAARGIPVESRRHWVVDRYAADLRARGGVGERRFLTIDQIRDRLAGRDLACWCPLDQACHADVLLRVADGRAP